jgi:hypothetical protein
MISSFAAAVHPVASWRELMPGPLNPTDMELWLRAHDAQYTYK